MFVFTMADSVSKLVAKTYPFFFYQHLETCNDTKHLPYSSTCQPAEEVSVGRNAQQDSRRRVRTSRVKMEEDNANPNNERAVASSYNYEDEGHRVTTIDRLTMMTEEEVEEELELIYGAKHVIMLFVPVGLCMAVVIATISSIDFFSTDDGTYIVYTPFHPAEGDSGGKTLLKSVLNSLILIGVVVVMTFLLILLYKYRCYKFIHGWIIVSSVFILFIFGFIYSQELLKSYNVPMDLFTIVLCMYNFGVMGIFVIHWKGPLKLQQAYLIISASLMSLIFIRYLPEWTLWLVLGLLAIWDLIAVLAPHGPLKMLVELATERGEQIMPALIYSSTVMYPTITMAKGKDKASKKTPKSSTELKTKDEPNQSKPQQSNEDNNESTTPAAAAPEADNAGEPEDMIGSSGEGQSPEQDNRRTSERITRLQQDIEDVEKGVKLGLGDFIFYSVLVGKASASGEPTIIIASAVGILMGLFLTLAILVTVRKALPALPISIAFGLMFYFSTRYLMTPMTDELSANQVFI